jgi:predicted small metal-binding protein
MDCDEVITGESDEEVIRKAAQHGAQRHNLQNISDDMKKRLRGLIKNA